ncbi:M6 family metalloprotease domain-containing protein [Cyclonatronum proteinivorum]|uniref:M6 family metalloprotease domain-containing protein n=2 Tax=Cyclonatronum proteinivorum TaxID=1457365 RepID=A0A345UI54_9BACT|nr:M6 family metalloprotease domain-containing protein [Cyclonatronum proteinivorum]
MFVNSFTFRRISVTGILLFFLIPCTFTIAQPIPADELAGRFQPFMAAQSQHGSGQAETQVISDGTVHILAVMVEFQPEENRFTSGNGTFALDYLMRDDITIGPLPHNRSYFESHLLFARNYFQQASQGQLELEFTVLPQVYRLNRPMREYSPTGPDDSENFRLGDLFYDTWSLVAQSDLPDLSHLPQDRTLFVIFHAGAGRDIELTGTTLDNTPQDIPSVFLSKESITRLSSDAGPDFDGIPLRDGVRVTNSAILPQTQSRRGEDVTGEEFVLELSINGILTANIGSFLGLPDLFDTETGRSGIGQFGLMDGAGIFAWYGLMPPLPSAWERQFMGWDTPFDISLTDDSAIQLPAASLGQPQSIARHRISTDEYFLVENRHRDPFGTGVELTFRLPDGSFETRVFTNEEERFSPTDQRRYSEIMPAGVLVNVSNFDWAVPGGLDIGQDGQAGTDDDRLLNGGILIWHIDEAVIREQKRNNAINNNPDRRGVSLQEADGAQDIGRPAGGLTNFSSGGPFDFWWSGNDFTVITASGQRIVIYENRFGDDTFPNNRSNTGSPSFFEFYDFSDNLPTASFRARRIGAENISLLFEGSLDGRFAIFDSGHYGWPRPLVIYRQDTGNSFLLVPGDISVHALPLDNEAGISFENRHSFGFGTVMPLYTQNGVLTLDEKGDDPTARFFQLQDGTFTKIWQTGHIGELSGKPSSRTGQTIDLDTTPVRLDAQTGARTIIDGGFQESIILGGISARIEDGILSTSDGSINRNLRTDFTPPRRYVSMVQVSENQPPQPLLLTSTALSLLAPDERDDIHLARAGSLPGISWPALVDFNGDGSLDFLFVDFLQNRLEGRNANGALLWDFPLEAPQGQTFLSSPLIADLTGDGRPDLLMPAADSLSYIIHGFDNRLRPLDGFPLYVGSTQEDVSYIERFPLMPVLDGNRLYAISNSGDLRVWELEGAGEVFWGSVYGNDPGNKLRGPEPDPNLSLPEFGLLNTGETYNWPNPASNETFIRYQTSTEADITITVLSMSGTRLYEQRLQARGGVPEEVLIDTSGWSSGAYYARVRASANGREETKLIRIAVIR